MSDHEKKTDYSVTLNLPKTDFPMRANLPQKEPVFVEYWQRMNLYKKLREQSKNLPLFVLHDGPPYANGHLHIGHALNKILKDAIIRSFQMRGFNASYLPGWDCHGLPIEWKVEEQYRASGKDKNEVPIQQFRAQCKEFAAHWVGVQREEFKRLGIIGDFENAYTTMDFKAEAQIAAELLKFVMSGQVYRGSKPVMWSVVERTSLAEAEIEYHDHESQALWVKFPIKQAADSSLQSASVVIWTTTPWTLPANRAVCFNHKISYSLYVVEEAENDYGPQKGEHFLLADKLASSCAEKAKLQLKRVKPVASSVLAEMVLEHPFASLDAGYQFLVPLLEGSHVADSAGTGFVHTAPSHGREDFDAWLENRKKIEQQGISWAIPFPVDDAGFYTEEVPVFGSSRKEGAARVVDDNGKEGDANSVIIAALIEQNRLFARAKIKHTYPYSWRSKKPVIFRNTPQWFIAMDKNFKDGTTLRSRALNALEEVNFIPAAGQTRLFSMIKDRPDWLISRQRCWGVPICIFANEAGEILKDEALNARILQAFKEEGADAWFSEGARERFLQDRAQEDWQQVCDILDVWFDSACTYSFTLEQREDLSFPADVCLEGSDQHRGWFHSSLLEACGTRGGAPYRTLITHGFTLDDKGKKMSKSLANAMSPKEISDKLGADILRLWVLSTDYWEDQRIGQAILQTHVDSYRKLRNIIRFMLGMLPYGAQEQPPLHQLPTLEQLMLHRLWELEGIVQSNYDQFNFKRVVHVLLEFASVELSAFYFDIRKDTLYCEAPSSKKLHAALYVMREIFEHFLLWLAPILPFTTEEAWQDYKKNTQESIHLQQFLPIPKQWCNKDLAQDWQIVRQVRREVTNALEQARAQKEIGSSLEAQITLYCWDKRVIQSLSPLDMAEICITSGFVVEEVTPEMGQEGNENEKLPIAVRVEKAKGRKCARSWRYTEDVGCDSTFPDVCLRDAQALHELKKLGRLKL